MSALEVTVALVLAFWVCVLIGLSVGYCSFSHRLQLEVDHEPEQDNQCNERHHRQPCDYSGQVFSEPDHYQRDGEHRRAERGGNVSHEVSGGDPSDLVARQRVSEAESFEHQHEQKDWRYLREDGG